MEPEDADDEEVEESIGRPPAASAQSKAGVGSRPPTAGLRPAGVPASFSILGSADLYICSFYVFLFFSDFPIFRKSCFFPLVLFFC